MSTLEVGSWASFAFDVAQRLQETTRIISKESCRKAFYSMLTAELVHIQNCFEDPGDTLCSPVGEHRLLELLGRMDRLCQITASTGPPSGRVELSNSRQYPNLAEILADNKFAENFIRSLTADSQAKTRVELITILKEFGEVKKTAPGPELSELQGPHKISDEGDDRAYIQALYSALASHCRCPGQASRADITTNLLLNCRGASERRHDSASFRLFFLDHPHQHGNDGSCQWQDAQVCVFRKREVRFETDQLGSCGTSFGKLISMGTFCKLISTRKLTQMKLDVSEEGLVLKGNGIFPRDFLLQVSSVSLATLLKIAKISRKMKLLLSYFLARAVWQFYDSDWMRRKWTKDVVHFMVERQPTMPKVISINKPFLSTRFDEFEPTKDDDDDFYRSHPFPKILALGIMLIEIELGISIEDYWLPECLQPDGQPTVNADHVAALEAFNKTELWDQMETFGAFKDVIGACLTPDDFTPYQDNTNGIRDVLEKRIVHPIQELYQRAWEDPDESVIRAIEINISGGMPSLPPLVLPQKHSIDHENTESKRMRLLSEQPVLAPMLRDIRTSDFSTMPSLASRSHAQSFCHEAPYQRTPSPSPLVGSVMSGSSNASSEGWFKRLDAFTFALRGKPQVQGATYRPTKIAVLDTGVNEDHAELIKGYKDFVDQEDDNCRDLTGHGTNAVKLIQNVYNKAEVYIGRVFKDSQARPNTPKLMTEAIYHAKDVWKVDIIVIASGFSLPNADMTRAIDEASKESVLIFAAASNYGNLEEIAFPGKLYVHHKLLCMFSTDANARGSPLFNPSASPAARYSFAVFGENVVIPRVDKPLSGTSYATMIGAAIAGRILDFSRHSDVVIREVAYLNTVEGMSAVFAKMARSAVDNGYHCIAPWKILPFKTSDGDEEMKRSDERKYVSETISRALENMYSGPS
ncbi:hypothetical protein V8C40DRAFT_238029 [Trichoderma camerunense]